MHCRYLLDKCHPTTTTTGMHNAKSTPRDIAAISPTNNPSFKGAVTAGREDFVVVVAVIAVRVVESRQWFRVLALLICLT